MTADATRRKALSVLREGRLTVLAADCPDNRHVPTSLLAKVQGHKGTYAVDLADGVWSCTCAGQQPCGHVAAAQLIAGTVAVAS